MSIGNTHVKRICFLMFLGAMGGCKTIYVPPTSGPVATLTTPTAQRKFSLASEAYNTMIAPVGNDNCRPLENVNAEFNTPEPTVSVKIAAGKEHFVGLLALSGIESCNVVFTFLPEVGKHYETKYVAERTRCFGSVVEIQNGKEIPVPIKPARIAAVGGVCKQ